MYVCFMQSIVPRTYIQLVAWSKLDESEKRKEVEILLDKLDQCSREERLQAARQIVFISLGNECMNDCNFLDAKPYL